VSGNQEGKSRVSSDASREQAVRQDEVTVNEIVCPLGDDTSKSRTCAREVGSGFDHRTYVGFPPHAWDAGHPDAIDLVVPWQITVGHRHDIDFVPLSNELSSQSVDDTAPPASHGRELVAQGEHFH
jgi:hypothetical protein